MDLVGRLLIGRVAQLGSALPWHGRGPEFKSRHVHHSNLTTEYNLLSSIWLNVRKDDSQIAG